MSLQGILDNINTDDDIWLILDEVDQKVKKDARAKNVEKVTNPVSIEKKKKQGKKATKDANVDGDDVEKTEEDLREHINGLKKNYNAVAIIFDKEHLNGLSRGVLSIDWTGTPADKLILDFSQVPDFDTTELLKDLRRQYISTNLILNGQDPFLICCDRRSFKLITVSENRQKKYNCTESEFLSGKKLDTKKRNAKVKTVVVPRLFTENEIKEHSGYFFDLSTTKCDEFDRKKRLYDPKKPSKDWLVVTENSDIIDKESGKIILKFRKQRIPFNVQKSAYNALVASAKFTRNSNRGVAGGLVDPERVRTVRPSLVVGKVDKFRLYAQLPTGESSKASFGNPSKSAIIGWTDISKRNEKHIKCRLTAYTALHMDLYEQSFPFFEHIDNVYKEIAEEGWKKQMAVAKKTDARVGDTSFSSITVNYDWRSALHKDVGDYKEGYGCFAVCQPLEEGGELLFPEYRVAVRVCSGDVLLFDSHAWHCTAPLSDGVKDRLSFVCYLREKIQRVCPLTK